MSKNPLLNAVAAALYISLVVSLIHLVGQHAPQEDSILAPMAALSLFTLSAATMGYVFLYHPFQLFMAGKAKQGLDLFLKTVLIFAAITGLLFMVIIAGLI